MTDSATPWTLQSMEFSRPEYWSRWPFPSPGDLPNPGIEPRSPTLQADSLPAEPPGRPKNARVGSLSLLQGVSCIAGRFFTNWAIREAPDSKESACNARDRSSILGGEVGGSNCWRWERSAGEVNGSRLQLLPEESHGQEPGWLQSMRSQSWDTTEWLALLLKEEKNSTTFCHALKKKIDKLKIKHLCSPQTYT